MCVFEREKVRTRAHVRTVPGTDAKNRSAHETIHIFHVSFYIKHIKSSNLRINSSVAIGVIQARPHTHTVYWETNMDCTPNHSQKKAATPSKTKITLLKMKKRTNAIADAQRTTICSDQCCYYHVFGLD